MNREQDELERLTFFSTAEDYMVESKELFGEHGFVIRLYNGEWELRMII
jgi:hypothetical protein